MPQRHKDTKWFSKAYTKIFLCVFVSLWHLFSSPAFAQEDTTRHLVTVPIIILLDSTVYMNDLNSTIPHYVISEENIKDLAVTDIGSVMKYVPGVQLKDYGGIGGIKTVSFRSLGANHTSVNVDGVRILNVQSGAINLSSFEIFGVQEVSFSSGQPDNQFLPASSYLQANSISVRSVLMQRPKKIGLKLYSNSTSINSFEEGLLVQFPIRKTGFFGVQAMSKFGKGDYRFVYPVGGISTPQKRQNSQLNNYKVKAMGGFQIKNNFFRFGFNYLNNEQELPGAIILYNPTNDQKLWNEDMRSTINYYRIKNNWTWSANLFYQQNFTRFLDPDFLNLQGFLDNSYKQKNGGGGALVSKTFESYHDWRVFFGSDFIHSALDGSNLSSSPKRMESNSVMGLSLGKRRLKIVANLSLQLIRDFTLSDSSTVTRDFAKPSPFVSFSLKPFKCSSFQIRSFYKRTFMMPTFNDLYYNFIGNSLLKPEEADLFNAGISLNEEFGKWKAEISSDVYYNQVKNKIVAIPTKDLFNWSMQNIGKVAIKGFDLGATLAYTRKNLQIIFSGTYNYNQSLDVTDSESVTYQKQIPYTPFHSATGGVSLHWKGYGLNANLIYSGFRYSLNENIYANYLEPFTDISVNLSKEIRLKKGPVFDLTLAALNLLNKNYEVIRSFPMPGRYYQFTLQFSL